MTGRGSDSSGRRDVPSENPSAPLAMVSSERVLNRYESAL